MIDITNNTKRVPIESVAVFVVSEKQYSEKVAEALSGLSKDIAADVLHLRADISDLNQLRDVFRLMAEAKRTGSASLGFDTLMPGDPCVTPYRLGRDEHGPYLIYGNNFGGIGFHVKLYLTRGFLKQVEHLMGPKRTRH